MTESKETKEDLIDRKCDLAGCDNKQRARHRQLFVNETWDCHPPADFKAWWEPTRFDPVLGSIGGHDEALRATPKANSPDEQHPEMDWHGCKTVTAWNCDRNRQEFYQWKSHL